MHFEELDRVTRIKILEAFDEEEESGNPYRGKDLSGVGLNAFPSIMSQAITGGDEETLREALAVPAFWNPTSTYDRNGVARSRRVNVKQASERLAISEFNTWYVRGLTARLIEEGVQYCQVYRAAQPRWEPADCEEHEGQLFPIREVLDGHRKRYWPEPGDPLATTIPFNPGCHHTIRRT